MLHIQDASGSRSNGYKTDEAEENASTTEDHTSSRSSYKFTAPMQPGADDTDDDYDLSGVDDSELDASTATIDNASKSLVRGPDNIAEHAALLADALSIALDSTELDDSLVSQAKTSGMLRNETYRLDEKAQELKSCINTLKALYKENFAPKSHSASGPKLRKVEIIALELAGLEKRLDALTNGPKASSISNILGTKRKAVGVAQMFPVEYNQARDKVLERQFPTDV